MGRFFNDDVESAQFCRIIRGGIFAHFSMFSKKKKDAGKKTGARAKRFHLGYLSGTGREAPSSGGRGARARARARALSTPALTGNSKNFKGNFENDQDKKSSAR